MFFRCDNQTQCEGDGVAEPEHVRRALARSAEDLGAPGKDDVFGWGVIGFTPDCS